MAEDLKTKIKILDNSIQDLKNERYKLNEQYIEELYTECQKNIGKCFKENDRYYYIVTKTSNIEYGRFGANFNEYRYEALCFEYPYNGLKIPYINKAIYINNMTKCDSYEEITSDEFISKLSEVNSAWLLSLKNK